MHRIRFQKYGNVFTLWLGPTPHVSITNYETCYDVFVKNGNNFKERVLPPLYDHVSEGLGILFSNGEIRPELRKFTLTAFRKMGVGKDRLGEIILAELDARCAELDAEGTTIVHTSEFFDLTVGSAINRLLVGKRFDEHNKDEFLKLRELMEKSAEYFTMFDMTAPVWLLKHFFPKRYEGNMTSLRNVLEFSSREAVQRWADVKAGEYVVDSEDPQDFVDFFFAKMDQEDRNGGGGHPAYTLESLKHVINDLWFAGQDTTSTTLVDGFNYLVNHPRVIQKVREEVLRVTDNGSRRLTLQDRAETHYLNATIAEIQRCASILNVNFWKIVQQPIIVNGYHIDSGAVITAQIGALQVNDNVFKSPAHFYPERFIENAKLSQQIIGNLLLRYEIQPHGALPSTADLLPYSSGKMPDKSTISYPILLWCHKLTKYFGVTYTFECLLLLLFFFFIPTVNLKWNNNLFNVLLMLTAVLLETVLILKFCSFPDIFAVLAFLISIQRLILLRFPQFQRLVSFKKRFVTFMVFAIAISSIVMKCIVPAVCILKHSMSHATTCTLSELKIVFFYPYFLVSTSILIYFYMTFLAKHQLPKPLESTVTKYFFYQTCVLFVSKSISLAILSTNLLNYGGSSDPKRSIFGTFGHTIVDFIVLPITINCSYILANRKSLGLRNSGGFIDNVLSIIAK
ncbi:unnamed protein product [Caenorhabditis sp. 36 PRJEB53466]|nr:unnamed protein product [Caenorhabditis sp. 36 PRJEB53466]